MTATLGDRVHRRRNDWERIPLGIPSAAGVRDPELRRCLDAMTVNTRYLIEKFKAVHRHPATGVVVKAPEKEVVIARRLPTVTTQAATAVAATSATLNGFVVPTGGSLMWYFEYGTTTAYGSTTTPTAVTSVQAAQAVAVNVTGLTGGTTYHFRLVGLAGQNIVYGDDAELTTILPLWTGDIKYQVDEYTPPSTVFTMAPYDIFWPGYIVHPGTSTQYHKSDCDLGFWSQGVTGQIGAYNYDVVFAGRLGEYFYNVVEFTGAHTDDAWYNAFCSPSFASDGYPYFDITVAVRGGLVLHFHIGYDHASH